MKWIGGITQWWKKQTEKSGKSWGILLILGLILAMVVWPAGEDNETSRFETNVGNRDSFQGTENLTYEEQLEEKLAAILSKVKGAGKVEVMITLESSSELVLQVDERKQEETIQEKSNNGEMRDSHQGEYTKETVLTGSTDDPYIVKEINPKVSGVLVLAQGAVSGIVKNEICEAVEALFNLPIHKIKVLEAE